MKVLQVINSLQAGGAEKLVVDMAVEFAKRGIKTDVLLLNGKSTPLYKRLNCYNDIRIHNIRGIANIYNPIIIFKIMPWLSKYDIVHVHLFPVSYWTAIAKLLSFKKNNIIFTEHNTTNRRRKKILFKYIDRIIYGQFDQIISISDAVDSSLKKHLGEKFKNIHKIYNGIHLDQIQKAKAYTKQELAIGEKQQVIVQVASFTPQKDQYTLIKAISRLPEEYTALLVGDGPLIETAKNLVENLQLNDRIQFLGIRDDVPRLLKSSDIVVLASHFEGLSLSCIEGMASGKPFIASNTPGLGDIVEGAGILFKDNDEQSLSNIISHLTTDKKYAKDVASKCQERAKKFDINIMIDKYIELYKTI